MEPFLDDDILSQPEQKKQPSITSIILSLVSILFVAAIGYLLWDLKINQLYYVAFIWIICVITALWWGNTTISNLLDKVLPWMKHSRTRFLTQIVGSTIYSLFCINITYYLFKVNFTDYAPDIDQVITLNLYGLLFIIPILTIQLGFYFMGKWKQVFVQTEHLKRANLKSQFETLKNHLDPHFLFNNLNILSSLIKEDNKDAHEFLDSFSDVYRYVLQSKKCEVVSLNEELQFADSYIFMLQKRFNWNIHFDIRIDEDLERNKFIPPLTLQMLIENIIKHNVISQERALYIDLYNDYDDCLVIRNNLQEKKALPNYSSKSGLDNIRKRYNYLSDRNIVVQKNDDYFTVIIPLLDYEIV
ncbi:histidine kinase [Limibacter armeniacum]|uniref:sensor histidine kinase n=1 Tax=Limibacter armeniacum TaxID=466084 RepID=UPI002FE51F2B